VVYGVEPLSPISLVPRPLEIKPSPEANKRVEEIKQLHEKVRLKIEKSNESYQAQANRHKKKVVFRPGDLVWVHLRKERFPSKRKTKLMPRVDGPFEVLERINDNAYKIDLPGDYGVSASFNVADLSPYLEDDYLVNLRTNSSQPGENDGGPSPSLNLITRSKFKSKIQEWVNVLLAQPSELSVWAYGISPGFVTSLEQGPDLELS